MSALALMKMTPCRRCLGKIRSGFKFVYFLTESVCHSSQHALKPYQVTGRGYATKSLHGIAIRTLSTKADSEPKSASLSGADCSTTSTVTPVVPEHGSELGPTFQDKQSPGRSRGSNNEQSLRTRQHSWIKPEGFDTGIQMYNTVTRNKEPLILPYGRTATWYACGPTVYDDAHLGHASSYVRIDTVRRILKHFFDVDVVLLMGVTDIDDKIIRRANETGVDFKEVALKYEEAFFQDMELLRVLPPTIKTRVSDHIPHIIRFVQRIMDNGHAYRSGGGTVYFDVGSYSRYGGKMATYDNTEGREPLDPEKHDPRDFALWKAAKPEEPWWESPWGRGRPGWHIECSTMASAVFGEKLDIHSGGDDLRFPHHENEIAQSEACFCSQQWTNYWLHTGYLHQKHDRAKMSKSLKNTISVRALLRSYTVSHFRLLCLLTHYRQPLEYGVDSMSKSRGVYSTWIAFLNTCHAYLRGQHQCPPLDEAKLMNSLEATKGKVMRAFKDDFDTPRAIIAIEELVHTANIELRPDHLKADSVGPRSPGVVGALVVYVEKFMETLGLQPTAKKDLTKEAGQDKFHDVVESAVKFRSEVRKYALNPSNLSAGSVYTGNEGETRKPTKQEKREQRQRLKLLFDGCDALRAELRKAGVVVEDHFEDSSWSMQQEASLSSAQDKSQPSEPASAKASDKQPKEKSSK